MVGTSDRERNVIEQSLNAESNARDRATIDGLTGAQERAYTEFLRVADELGVDPKPVPHVHTPHQEIAARCLWGALLATGGGMLVAIFLTAGVVANAFIGACGAVLLFVIAEAVLDVAAFALNRTTFVRRFVRMYITALALFSLSVSVLLVGRFATPTLAEELLLINAYVWWGLEASLLSLGALSIAGWRRFGWSLSLYNEYNAYEQRICELKLFIERRITDSKATILALCFVAASFLSAAPAFGQTIMIDRSGSLADQDGVEGQLQESLTSTAQPLPPTIKTVLFSEHAFEGLSVILHPPAVRLEDALFRPLGDAIRRQAALAMKAQLRDVLQTKLPVARCTSIPDVLARAALEEPPVLLITDGYHDCGLVKAHPQKHDGIIIVLVRSKFDRASDGVLYFSRSEEILRYVPNAMVLPQFRLPFAVEQFLTRSRGHTASRLVSQ